MSEEQAPARLSIVWSDEARPICAASTVSRPRHLPRRPLHRNGDVKKLKPPQTGFRLRCGDYRLFFEFRNETAIEVIGVRHRREATVDLPCRNDVFNQGCYIRTSRKLPVRY